MGRWEDKFIRDGSALLLCRFIFLQIFKSLVQELKGLSTEIKDDKELASVATVSAGGRLGA